MGTECSTALAEVVARYSGLRQSAEAVFVERVVDRRGGLPERRCPNHYLLLDLLVQSHHSRGDISFTFHRFVGCNPDKTSTSSANKVRLERTPESPIKCVSCVSVAKFVCLRISTVQTASVRESWRPPASLVVRRKRLPNLEGEVVPVHNDF